ncbi:Sensor histidine kinase RegB [Paracoccus marcusii]|uniref:ATP-binding protein n=1 Tax=Paracoccus marcusii TaxID=59779 RepID=UPI001C3E44F7|nr:ATP-binding protein [Paracoccus marcusii]QXI64449.1 Sensor histidine kinase RegB [Paracoccus marcusii]
MKTQSPTNIAQNAARRNLAQLNRMRWIAVAGQLLAIWGTVVLLDVTTLPWGQMLPVVGFLIFLNLFSAWRLRRAHPITDLTVTAELLMDVASLTILLYLSGGASNPFVSLFILQVILAIVLLPQGHAALILLATIAAHFWLTGNGVPLPLPHLWHGAGPSFLDLHLQGMFLSFLLAASLLTWFVTRITANLRDRDAQIQALRQQMLEEDHLVRLGLLSSGAAHELGTPLTTLAVTLDDWQTLGAPQGDELDDKIAVMQRELSRCRQIVSEMLLSSGQERLDEAQAMRARAFLEAAIEGLALPVRISFDMRCDPVIMADPMLEQAVRQLVDNAAEAGSRNIRISLSPGGAEQLALVIEDDGPGFPDAILADPGQPFQSDKDGPGRGLGLFLTGNVMRRLNGEMRLANLRHGAQVTLLLPTLETAA